MKKQVISTLLALAMCAGLAVPAAAADRTIYLDGYSNTESAGTKECDASKAQLSLTGDLMQDGSMNVRDFSENIPLFSCPIYAAKGPVKLTIMDAADDGLIVKSAQIDGMTYDAAAKFYKRSSPNAVFFDGTVSFTKQDQSGTETMTIQEFNQDETIWDRVGSVPSIADGATVTLTEPGMYGVTIYLNAPDGGCVLFIRIEEEAAVGGFTDVKEADYFSDAVLWAVDQKVTTGTTDTTFTPDRTCSVSEILAFLWRAKGSPAPTIANPYADGSAEGWFKDAALWACENGLVGEDTFPANAPCTRAMVATYLWKLAGSPDASGSAFTDVAADAEYAQAVAWAVAQGVTTGTGDGTTFSPDKTCTRGEIVTFLYRALGK